MICQNCGSDQLIVTNSRSTNHDTQIWRRRKCQKCNFVFTTHEKIDLSQLIVIKKSGKRVRYVAMKLYSSIYNAVVNGKKVDRGDAGVIAQNIFFKVEEDIILRKTKSIKTSEIGNIVLKNISSNNLPVWLRFFAYFKSGTKKLSPSMVKKYLNKI